VDELDAQARLRVRIAGVAAAILGAIIVALAGAAARQPLTDAFQRWSPVRTPAPRVAVVLIDGPSLAAVGGWPWSRYAMARLTETIAAAGPKAVGFDFLFPEPDRLTPGLFADLYPELPADAAQTVRRLPSMDGVFARVIGRSPVVLARAGVQKGSFDASSGSQPLPPEAQFEGPPPPALTTYPEVVANLPILDGAPLGHGLVNGAPDPDGVIRRMPLLARAGGVLTPSFALELVRVAQGVDRVRLQRRPGGRAVVVLGRLRIPVDSAGRAALRFRDPPVETAVSAVDLLRCGGASAALKDKIVLVGLAAAATSDVVITPRASQTYGVLVQAQAVEDYLSGALLDRPAWAAWVEWALGALGAVAALLFATRLGLGGILAGGIALTVAAVGASFAGFLHGLVLDPAPALAPGGAAAAAVVGLMFVEGRAAQRRLRAALDEERLAAAKVAGELSAASEIQAGMLLPRAALATVSDRAELDAVLQPARRVGGDLYDAFLLEGGRLCFLVGDVTGKGVPASLFMALSKALSRSLLMQPGMALDAAVAGINAELSRDNGQMMAVALLVGVLDPGTGALELVSAGCENPLIVGVDGVARELRLDGGPPLCVAEGFPYPVERAELGPGETLVALTDGVTEAQDPEGRLFGRKQALAAISGAGRPLAEMVDGLVAAVRAFEAGGEPSDDLTVLALRRRG
jgi:serine phosphatase RsbU (regulator of sigma subunit)